MTLITITMSSPYPARNVIYNKQSDNQGDALGCRMVLKSLAMRPIGPIRPFTQAISTSRLFAYFHGQKSNAQLTCLAVASGVGGSKIRKIHKIRGSKIKYQPRFIHHSSEAPIEALISPSPSATR